MKQICYVVCTEWVGGGGGHRNVVGKNQHVGHKNQTEPVKLLVNKMVGVCNIMYHQFPVTVGTSLVGPIEA